jgi:subtilisin family serine protease
VIAASKVLRVAAVLIAAALVAPAPVAGAVDEARLARTSRPRPVAPEEGERLVASAVRFAAELPPAAGEPRLVLSPREFDPGAWTAIPEEAGLVVRDLPRGTLRLADVGWTPEGETRLWWAIAARDTRTGALRMSEVRSLTILAKSASRKPGLRPVVTGRLTDRSAVALAGGLTGPANRPPIRLEAGYTLVPGGPAPAIPQPLASEPSAIGSSEPVAGGGMRAYLVQFPESSPEMARARIEAAGGTVFAYVPEQAYLIRLGGRALDQLNQGEDAPWMTPWEPAYKLSPLLERSGTGRLALIAQLFPDADPGTTTAELMALGANGIRPSNNGINRLVHFEIDPAQLARAAALEAIAWIESAPRFELLNDLAQWVVQTGTEGSRRMWDAGLRGQNQVIMTSDTGVRTTHDQFRDNAVDISAFGDYPAHRKIIAYKQGSEDPLVTFGDDVNSHWHGTHTAGTTLGSDDGIGNSARDGMASEAKLYFMDIAGPSLGGAVAPNADLNDLFLPSYLGNAGGAARISSHSWGYRVNGAYTLSSMQVDQFTWEHPDFLIAFANGNDGSPGSVHAPATAKNCISVGGTGNGTDSDQLYPNTSRGPTRDLRRKPTLCAPAHGVTSSIGSTRNAYAAYSGTSMATPIVAGALALVRQYLSEGWYPTGAPVPANAFAPSAALLKAMAVNAAENEVAGYTAPDQSVGWGRLDLDNVLYLPGETKRCLLADHTDGLGDQQFVEYEVRVTDPEQPLGVTLCWTDAPGHPAAQVQLVNDLDLVVTNGVETYRGNVYAGGSSVPGGRRDSVNVEENIRIASPGTGVWTVRVEAHRIPMWAQPFALCITGGVAGESGAIAFDRAEYAPADTLEIQVIDTNASAPLSVVLTSPTEPAGETVVLIGGNGVFRAALPAGPAATTAGDGVLSVSTGDVVTATYSGTAPIHSVSATALVGGEPPRITDVRAVPLAAGSVLITWKTDRAASSRVWFGSWPTAPGSAADSEGYRYDHAVKLSGLAPGASYLYDVESASLVGAVARDSLGGAHRSFTVKQPGSVALVLGDPAMDGSEAWPAALEILGYDYDILTGSDIAPPLVGNASRGLRAYAAVLWQAGLDDYPSFSDVQRAAIDSLLEGGARLLVTGHDVGYSLSDAGAPSYTPEREAWFSSGLKSIYQADPLEPWVQQFGVEGDPISGDATLGIPYTDLDDGIGRSGDQVILAPTNDGTGWLHWYDGLVPQGANGVRWESAGPRGMPGSSFWGGRASRLVAMFFEWSRMGSISNPHDPERAAVLDRSIAWLLGRHRPRVTIQSPTGGEVFSSNVLPVQYSIVPDPDFGISRAELSYSLDGGATWVLLESDLDSATGYEWDLAGRNGGEPVLNSTRVRLRLRAFDTGSPSLAGVDVSEVDVVIARPDGDMAGPVIMAGTARTAPAPLVLGSAASLVATISDQETGGSNILAAEWSVGSTAAAAGSGTPMNGTFGAPSVEVTVDLPTEAFTSRRQSLWLRGQDSAGRWGPAAELPVIVNGAADVEEPAVVNFLSPASPNPFSTGGTAIRFGVAQAGEVRLEVFNVVGRRVRTLSRGSLPAGGHAVAWDGSDDSGRAVPPGVYFVRLVVPGEVLRSRVVALR